MRVNLNADPKWDKTISKPTLILQATCPADRVTLEAILKGYVVAGFGRDRETNSLLHVEIAIERN